MGNSKSIVTPVTENFRKEIKENEAKKVVDESNYDDGPGVIGNLPAELRWMIFHLLPESIGTMRLVILIYLNLKILYLLTLGQQIMERNGRGMVDS